MSALYLEARSLILDRRRNISQTRNPQSRRDFVHSVSLGLSLGDDKARSVDIFVNATPGQALHSQLLTFVKQIKDTIPQQTPAGDVLKAAPEE